MKIMIRGLNIELTPSIKRHIEEKMAAFEEHLDGKHASLAEARVEVGKSTKHHHKGEVFYAEANVKIGGEFYRAANNNEDLHAAINRMSDELGRQFRKHKTREIARKRGEKSE